MRTRADILGCGIDRLDMDATVREVERIIASRRFIQHVSINTAKLVSLHDDAELRRIVEGCGLINADGAGVVWASRLLRDPLPARVAGIDLMHRLLARAEGAGYRVYFLGARADVLQTALERIRERHPRLVIAGARDGYFSDAEATAVATSIRETRPDIVFVAMSSPRKEYFIGTHGEELGAPFVMGVGGSIDVVAGITRRAPRSWQRLGLEWLFRLIQEPRRLFRRYAVTNARFAWLLGRALLPRGGRS